MKSPCGNHKMDERIASMMITVHLFIS